MPSDDLIKPLKKITLPEDSGWKSDKVLTEKWLNQIIDKVNEQTEAINELYKNPVTVTSTEDGWPHVRKSPGWCYVMRPDGMYLEHCDAKHPSNHDSTHASTTK